MKMCTQTLRINTKVKDFDTIRTMVDPIIQFANEKGIGLNFYSNKEDGHLYSECTVTGQSTRYCKALVADVKDMIRQAFHCKLDIIYHAW